MTTSITDTNDTDLIKEAKQLHDVIYNVECFGTRDMLRLDCVLRELELRGYQITGSSKLAFVRVK